MDHLANRGGGQPRMDAAELRERLDGPKRDRAGGDLRLQGLGQLQDPQVLTDAGLRGLQPLRNALYGPA